MTVPLDYLESKFIELYKRCKIMGPDTPNKTLTCKTVCAKYVPKLYQSSNQGTPRTSATTDI